MKDIKKNELLDYGKTDNTSPFPTSDKHAVAWVSNGVIHVRNSPDGDTKALLSPCKEIQVKVNGNLIFGPTDVSAEDHIEVVPIGLHEPGQVKVLLSEDRMAAFLEIKSDYERSYVLMDSAPVNHLFLKAQITEKHTHRETPDSLLKILKDQNISYGLDMQALASICHTPKDGLTLVAKGLLPGQSTDDYVELSFEINRQRHSMDSSGTINYKELSLIPSVVVGELLARKVPGSLGEPGINVLTQKIKAKEPRRINLLAGVGVEVSDDGLRAIATSEGLPKIQKSDQNWMLSIEPILTINGDVNLKTGNIRFKGDVHILGSVDNDMSVSASGNIIIHNLATKCKITAGGDVTIHGNVMNAEVISGGFIIICKMIKPLLQELLKTLEDMYISASLMLEKIPAHSQSKILFGNILVLLIEKKFTNFNGLLDKIQKKLKEMDLKLLGGYEDTLQTIINNLTGINILQYQTITQFQNTLGQINNFFYYVESLVDRRSFVDIKVALNSVIQSSGDVHVSGGCFNTHIISEGLVNVNGVVRGGIIQALDDVFVKQIGSELGTKSMIVVAKDKQVRITEAFDGVVIQVGKASKVLEMPMKNIRVNLDEEGFVQILHH